MATAHNGLSQPLPDVRMNGGLRFLPAAGLGTAVRCSVARDGNAPNKQRQSNTYYCRIFLCLLVNNRRRCAIIDDKGSIGLPRYRRYSAVTAPEGDFQFLSHAGAATASPRRRSPIVRSLRRLRRGRPPHQHPVMPSSITQRFLRISRGAASIFTSTPRLRPITNNQGSASWTSCAGPKSAVSMPSP